MLKEAWKKLKDFFGPDICEKCGTPAGRTISNDFIAYNISCKCTLYNINRTRHIRNKWPFTEESLAADAERMWQQQQSEIARRNKR